MTRSIPVVTIQKEIDRLTEERTRLTTRAATYDQEIATLRHLLGTNGSTPKATTRTRGRRRPRLATTGLTVSKAVLQVLREMPGLQSREAVARAARIVNSRSKNPKHVLGVTVAALMRTGKIRKDGTGGLYPV